MFDQILPARNIEVCKKQEDCWGTVSNWSESSHQMQIGAPALPRVENCISLIITPVFH